jgi:hypothetical protein
MISFGTDPEFMIQEGDKYRSAIGIVQGSKENRVALKGHQFFYDNVLAECAVKPGKTKKQTLKNISECLKLYSEMVSPFKLVAQAAQEYPASELKHPEAKRVGCDPDMCVYEMEMQRPPIEEVRDGELRTCGGHIHLGSKMLKADGPEPIRVIQMMDLFLGVPSLWLDTDPTSPVRRNLYGQAGRYRTCPKYGIEYRSLGNFWFKHPALTGWIYDACIFIHSFVETGEADKLWDFDIEVLYDGGEQSEAWTCTAYDPHRLKLAIDSSDKDMAEEYYTLAKSLMPLALKEELERLLDSNLTSDESLL